MLARAGELHLLFSRLKAKDPAKTTTRAKVACSLLGCSSTCRPPCLLSLNLASTYFDVQEYLADGQKLPCKIRLDIPNTGHLEGTAEKHLRLGTLVELPFWLAATLSAKDAVDLMLPRPYTTRVRNALAAAPGSVNLRNLGGGGGAFYAGGTRLDGLSEDPTLAETLNSAFRDRMIEVMDQSQHTSADSGGEGAAYEFCQALDTWEKELFMVGEASAKAIRTWDTARVKTGPGGAR